ncbi:MAG: hypothetical protein LBS55_12605 [Prevotellaceae bacterium]|jgi:hypothetical protein|nr:hypothetical protein [Prevotellaceae bacterium]
MKKSNLTNDMADYRQLAQSVQNRLNPDRETLLERKIFSDLSDASTDILKYIKLAMRGVEPEYTEKSIEAGQRVKEHLSPLSNVTFKYQGSVMTNTHIKGHSDIDLLTICEKFYTYDSLNVNNILSSPIEKEKYNYTQISKLERETQISTYTGNYLEDLRNIRFNSENILRDIYSQFDNSNGKAIKIRNLSLKRDVDVVTASWYDGVSSIINDKGDFRGIQVYDKNKDMVCPVDYPFLSIKRINERGKDTNDRLKKMIRFLKNLKSDAKQNIDLSSFDINAICYGIGTEEYINQDYKGLVAILYVNLFTLCNNKSHSDNLKSVDGNEYIFRNNPEKLENLKRLFSEINSIIQDINK